MELPNAAGGESKIIDCFPTDYDLNKIVLSKVECSSGREDTEDPFYVVDLGRIIELYESWTAAMPDVKPYYAVKSNPDLGLVKTLATLGANFEVVSKKEMKMILDLGVSPDHIIYGNPFKQPSYIEYATKMGVELMVFDCEEEMVKIKAHQPSAKLILRLACAYSVEEMNTLNIPQNKTDWEKFGANVASGKALLQKAKELELNVVGVSFQALPEVYFTGSKSSGQYTRAMESCDEMFSYAAEIGFKLSLLDIGGGFPESEEEFRKMSLGVMACVNEFSVKHGGITVVAEPGRYFASSPCTLATCVIGKKVIRSELPMYIISDGAFRSFAKMKHWPEHKLQFAPLKETCDSEISLARFCGPALAPDQIGCFKTPELSVGDWVYFIGMGAYTLSMVSSFFYFPKPAVYYYVKERHRDKLDALFINN